ncbi:nucleoside hydrolase [Arcanobacterium hippocoleae]
MQVILNADTGVDDILALAYLLASAETELLGIAASYGNVEMQTALRNTLAALEILAPQTQIPVWAGSESPSWANGFIPDAGCACFHGANGFANLNAQDYGSNIDTISPIISPSLTASMAALHYKDPKLSIGGYVPADSHAKPAVNTQTPAAEFEVITQTNSGGTHSFSEISLQTQQNQNQDGKHGEITAPAGVTAIIEAVRKYGQNLVIAVTGPLTDIDRALQLAPDIAGKLRVVCMGGALMTAGNCYDAVSETNIIQDPEAAARVFASGADVTLVGLDVTERCLLPREKAERWSDNAPATGYRPGAFLTNLAAFSISANANAAPKFSSGMPLHDPLAAAAALNPELITTIELPLTVQTETVACQSIRGRCVIDQGKMHHLSAPRVKVAIDVNSALFVEDFAQRLEFFRNFAHQNRHSS